jgi:hypothetical protein
MEKNVALIFTEIWQSLFKQAIYRLRVQTSGGRSYTFPKILKLHGDLPPSKFEILKKKLKKSIHWLPRKLRFKKPHFKQAFWRFLQTYLWGEVIHPSKNSGTSWRPAPINIQDFEKDFKNIHARVVRKIQKNRWVELFSQQFECNWQECFKNSWKMLYISNKYANY